MVVAMPVKDAQSSLNELIERIATEGDRVILETRGEPKAALVSLSDLRALQAFENKEVLARELPALLRVLDELRDAIHAGKPRRIQSLLQDVDDFMATIGVANEPTRAWSEFVDELDADLSTAHTS